MWPAFYGISGHQTLGAVGDVLLKKPSAIVGVVWDLVIQLKATVPATKLISPALDGEWGPAGSQVELSANMNSVQVHALWSTGLRDFNPWPVHDSTAYSPRRSLQLA
jgi:hypothetical protein